MAIMLPKIDFAFKLLFGDQRSKNILADFLKAVLPDLASEEFEELTITDPHLKREFSGDKLEILDVKLRTAGGKSIDIEIQISSLPEMRSRISYYQSNMITEQIGMGGHYQDLQQAITIVIADYDIVPETLRCHTTFMMLEREEHFPFNGLMEIDVLNLARLPKEGEGKLLDWLRFLKAETEEEIKMIAAKDPIINEAYCKLQEMSEDEANRRIYEARLKAQRDDYSRMRGAHREGLEEGRREGLVEGEAKGRREGRAETTGKIILEMGKSGMGVKDIAAITHLSEQEVSSILKQGNG
jgi:predicted transposase/invertase (TIGR01784 family)